MELATGKKRPSRGGPNQGEKLLRCSMELAAIRVHTWIPRALQATKNTIEYNDVNASLAVSSAECTATCSSGGIDLPARYQGPISTDPRILATSRPSTVPVFDGVLRRILHDEPRVGCGRSAVEMAMTRPRARVDELVSRVCPAGQVHDVVLRLHLEGLLAESQDARAAQDEEVLLVGVVMVQRKSRLPRRYPRQVGTDGLCACAVSEHGHGELEHRPALPAAHAARSVRHSRWSPTESPVRALWGSANGPDPQPLLRMSRASQSHDTQRQVVTRSFFPSRPE